MKFLDWLEGLPPSEWVAQSDFGYPLMLSIHSIGMSAVVGLLLVLDLWVLGVGRRIPVELFKILMPVAWVGFAFNLISGILLFDSTAHRLLINWGFWSKMGCIVAAGAVTWLLWRQIDKAEAFEARHDGAAVAIAIPASAKALAVLSIVLWLLAITFGRLIAYIMDHAILNGQA